MSAPSKTCVAVRSLSRLPAFPIHLTASNVSAAAVSNLLNSSIRSWVDRRLRLCFTTLNRGTPYAVRDSSMATRSRFAVALGVHPEDLSSTLDCPGHSQWRSRRWRADRQRGRSEPQRVDVGVDFLPL